MSRIGRLPIQVPQGVQVDIKGTHVVTTGPKGTLERRFHPDMKIVLEGDQLCVTRPTDNRQHRALHGLTRALLANMVTGVSQGYLRELLIEGVGYRAELQGNSLVLNLGFSHAVTMEPPTHVTFKVEDRGKRIVVEGIDKEVVGQICADIRKRRPPEPYLGKGIRYKDEYVRRKAGKSGRVV
ncbi:MAG: 50S ribosomal protein L6 [Anaerolineae bacterium]|nr:MAG: 50S ribosomal protein L6 [Anaerolineae bacterium]